MNTNESVKVVFKATLSSATMRDMVNKVAVDMVDNGVPMPEEFTDVFVIDVITRPSGSKYAVIDFA